MVSFNVDIPAKGLRYPIFIENYEISELKHRISACMRGSKFLAVISEKVNKLYGKKLGFNNNEIFILKDGESQKNFKNYQKIIDRALKIGLTRQDAIIAVGGGVAGDIAGFAAATYMRGIDFIQVPTTLLACVDSSVGGKTAVNTPFGKNLAGCFYQPKAVFINMNFLKTLDERQYKAGLGEVVKYIFIEKSCNCSEELNLTNFITDNTKQILSHDMKTLEKLIEICIKLKLAVVEQDEKETGLRKILNFGHTFGHAIEKAAKYKRYTHGEAVVMGILFAFNLAERLGLIDKNYKFFAEDILSKFNFKEIPDFKKEKLLNAMKSDKKATTDKIVFILPVAYSVVKEFSFNADEINIG